MIADREPPGALSTDDLMRRYRDREDPVLLEGGYTRAEETLTANDKADVVHAGRLGLQGAMRQAMIAAVEQTTGRRVHSFMSANDLEQGLQVEVFVLAPQQDEGVSGLGG